MLGGATCSGPHTMTAVAAVVPTELRPALSEVLQQLVRGDFPDMLLWVRGYGPSGATLVQQPEPIWSHRRWSVIRRNDGAWRIALPLWTTDESPGGPVGRTGRPAVRNGRAPRRARPVKSRRSSARDAQRGS